MSYQNVLLLVFCMAAALRLQAADQTSALASANAAYQNKDFAGAIRQYESLLQQGYRSEALYYNLGNSYYRTNDWGKAVLNYERALLLDPTDADTRHNLQVVQSKLPDQIDPLPAFFLFKWWNNLGARLSPQTWSVLALSLLWIGMAGLTVWLLGKIRRYKKAGFIAGVSCLLMSILSFLFANSRTSAIENSDRAVILQREITLRSAPDPQSREVLSLHAGTTIRLLDQIGSWYKVVLRNGEQGWLPEASFEPI